MKIKSTLGKQFISVGLSFIQKTQDYSTNQGVEVKRTLAHFQLEYKRAQTSQATGHRLLKPQ